jgi:uncharacterized OB-fold protein
MGKKRKQVAAIEGLFTWPSEHPKLIASSCKNCQSVSFPSSKYCNNPNCNDGNVTEIELSPTGKLYSYTIQHYAPPPPYVKSDPFKPFAIGLVELPEKIRVVGMITGCDISEVKIGMPVNLVAEKIYEEEVDDEIREVMTWKWKAIIN